MAESVKTDVLVEPDWLEAHLNDPTVRIVESSENAAVYGEGHVPNAILLHWKNDLQDPIVRDWVDRDRFAGILGERGISDAHTVVFYGDKNNWFAAYTFWLFKYYGHRDARILNGGRDRWGREGRRFTTEVPRFPPADYRPLEAQKGIRAFRDDVLSKVQQQAAALVDVRSPEEFRGDLLAPPAYPQEGAQRPGHIPGAVNVPWGQNVREDGNFKSASELRRIYESQGVTPGREVIAYCRIGERSSLTWFTLKHLLGYPNVKNYDGSWTEWGSLVGAPIER